jgi:hypothetical protein
MIFPPRKREKEKSSTFAAEIHSRNGLILFHEDFSGGSVERDTRQGFFIAWFFVYYLISYGNKRLLT